MSPPPCTGCHAHARTLLRSPSGGSVPFDTGYARTGKGQFHEVLAPDDLPLEHGLDLVHDLLANARLVDLREQVREDERLHTRALRDERVVLVVPARRSIGRRWCGTAEVVVHVDQHIAPSREFHNVVRGTAVAGVA